MRNCYRTVSESTNYLIKLLLNNLEGKLMQGSFFKGWVENVNKSSFGMLQQKLILNRSGLLKLFDLSDLLISFSLKEFLQYYYSTRTRSAVLKCSSKF